MISKNKMITKNIKKNNKGFVILFAITISSILLAIALGVANIALKEVKFGTNARDTNNAFFAADSGIEYALFTDKPPTSPYTLTPPETSRSWPLTFTGLGSTGQSCAKVTIVKTDTPTTTITSKGYNMGDASCDSTNPDRIEREIITSY